MVNHPFNATQAVVDMPVNYLPSGLICVVFNITCTNGRMNAQCRSFSSKKVCALKKDIAKDSVDACEFVVLRE